MDPARCRPAGPCVPSHLKSVPLPCAAPAWPCSSGATRCTAGRLLRHGSRTEEPSIHPPGTRQHLPLLFKTSSRGDLTTDPITCSMASLSPSQLLALFSSCLIFLPADQTFLQVFEDGQCPATEFHRHPKGLLLPNLPKRQLLPNPSSCLRSRKLFVPLSLSLNQMFSKTKPVPASTAPRDISCHSRAVPSCISCAPAHPWLSHSVHRSRYVSERNIFQV